MKTSFLKRLMMPLAVIVLGIAGAFTTTSMSSAEKKPTNTTGYRFVSQLDPRHPDIMCSVSYIIPCTSGSNTLWNKANSNINICDVPYTKFPN